MEKIGLCLAYAGTNYGQNLQAFATQHVIEDYGYQTEIIDYHSGKDKGIKLSLAVTIVAMQKISGILKKELHRAAVSSKLDAIHRLNDEERKKQADRFRAEKLHNIVRCNGITELQNRSKNYSAVLVGSDQIWLPNIAVTNFYTLRFAAPGVRRISYATSMGVSKYPDYAKKSAADFWREIDYLSVREQQAKDIIQAICNVDVKVVADPTYLLTKEQWREKIPPRKVVEDGYVLCYLLGEDAEIKQYCRRFADAKGLRLVGILSNECTSDDFAYCDEVVIGKGPEDFVNLIRNAGCVLTDSFHGIAFSVIHEKDFYIFYRRRTDVKESRNSRIDNIVATWGLEDRLISDPASASPAHQQIDYVSVNDRLEKLRAYSLDFLEQALSGR